MGNRLSVYKQRVGIYGASASRGYGYRRVDGEKHTCKPCKDSAPLRASTTLPFNPSVSKLKPPNPKP